MKKRPLQHSILQSILNELPREEMLGLLFPGKHMALLSARRAALIISRVRLIAMLFAILTALFILPDLAMLPWPLSGRMGVARTVTSIAFWVLAFSFHGSNRIRDAYLSLGLMFAIPTAFFLVSSTLLSQAGLDGMPVNISTTIQAAYSFLPLLIVAGLSMFPLTALEGAAVASLVLAADVLAAVSHTATLSLGTVLSTSGLVLLIAIVATLSAMSQLGFMITLVQTAIRDKLTDCFSRASGVELLDIQFTIASRSKAPLSIAFVDLDNFKSVNDTFGHDAGDQVLVNAAHNIRSTLRTGDMLARWGGEEFILIMPNTRCHDAVFAIERLRGNGLGMRPDDKPMTASIGISERTEDNAADWKTLVEIADQRMYQAKQSGKNQAVHACNKN